MRACPNCATEVADDAVFCRKCGTALAETAGEERGAPAAINPPVRSRNVWAIPMIVIGFLTCLTVAFFEVTTYAVIFGFVGFAMFAFGGIIYLMSRVNRLQG